MRPFSQDMEESTNSTQRADPKSGADQTPDPTRLSPSASCEYAHWKPDEMAFVMSQIARESPYVAKDRVASAVNSAAQFVPSTEGRVQLMRRAREFLRPPR